MAVDSNRASAPRTQYRDDETDTGDTITLEDSVLIDRSEASDEETFQTQRPRWSRYVPKLPTRAQNTIDTVSTWIKGPQPPRRWQIKPFFPSIQEAPTKLLDRYFSKRQQKIALLVGFYICWFICFSAVLYKSSFAADVPGFGPPRSIGCGQRFWGDGNSCGLNGDSCRPFANQTFAFRCPANCKRVIAVNDHAVGDQEINYRQIVVGGSAQGHEELYGPYRADSFVCGSAIHSGFISNDKGGCGAMRFSGEAQHYHASKAHGISSISFDSYFPKSFSFVPGSHAKCQDLRWPLLAVSLTFSVLLSLFTTSPPVFFWSTFIGLFLHTALVSDPPTLTDYYALVSICLERLLPASFCAFVVYKYCAKRTLTGLTAQFEKTILWVGGCWVGCLNNYTFDRIPIQRLTPHDLKQQPGAIPALIIVVTVLICITIGQAWSFRVEGRMPQYLALYCTLGAGLIILAFIPNMNLRIHHYILGLLLVPGTSMQTRPSLLYQGLLVGLFINGVARWGFASILETPFALRGDAKLGTLIPVLLPPIVHLNTQFKHLKPNITFNWERPLPENWEGVSVLVNDVERHKVFEDEGASKQSFTWVKEHEDVNEYFRFGYLSGSWGGDYSKAGVWTREGAWKEMKTGPSL